MFLQKSISSHISLFKRRLSTQLSSFPKYAEVVVVGGGSQGCNTLYQLSKRNCSAVLLERNKITSGTTWHTAGLVWRLRPNDVDVQLLAKTRDTFEELLKTQEDVGWIMNGGLFIAHSHERLQEYKRLATLGKAFGIESHVLSPEEACKVFPLLDPTAFTGSLYSPGDGTIDPSAFCSALLSASKQLGNDHFENVDVTKIVFKENYLGNKYVVGVETSSGYIETNCVVNATGVWGSQLMRDNNLDLPLVAMKHAYIVTEDIEGVKGSPNVRDHDYSIYFRIQGNAICMGGYEVNPIILKDVPKDFAFGLYDLDWSTFESHIDGAEKLCKSFKMTGIKTTICGPESFTPDHKPLLGPDPRVDGVFHNCGYNSAGMMFSGGCADQIAEWILKGRPSFYMHAFDIRRFWPKQCSNKTWIDERSHESYAKNYSIVYPFDSPTAGRNFIRDPFHEALVESGAVMEERHGWERPGYFLLGEVIPVNKYDWYGAYGNPKNENDKYKAVLGSEYTFGFPKHEEVIRSEALSCRENAVLFDLSYFGKMYITGPDAQKSVDWIFTANLDRPLSHVTYTCSLNDNGGTEADVTVVEIESGSGKPHDPRFDGKSYYVVAGGASAQHTLSHIKEGIRLRNFQAQVEDVTENVGILSIQGPNSRSITENLLGCDLGEDNFPLKTARMCTISLPSNKKTSVRVMRVSFVGELGFELHISKEDCSAVYNQVMLAGNSFNLRNAGFRSLYALSAEKGFHLWGFDLRPDDTPLEAGLAFACRKSGIYRGKEKIDLQRRDGFNKKLVYLTTDKEVPLLGLEALYRNGEVIGHLRRGGSAYYLDKSIGQAYIDSAFINPQTVEGHFEIESFGQRFAAECLPRSPFDRENKRIKGVYS